MPPSILGLEPNGRDPDGGLFLRMDEHHHRFTMYPGGNDDLVYIGWQVTDEAALDRMAVQLESTGVTVTRGSTAEADARRVRGLISFRDPNRIATEIYYGPQIDDAPFQSPRSVSGFVAGSQGLGHIVLEVDDPSETMQFYCDALGMRATDFIQMSRPGFEVKLTFLHCNPRHHSLAFTRVRGKKRLVHFMLQLTSLDDVGTTWTLCKEREVPIQSDLGRHSNDRMVSFYPVSPSGFTVEYGWGAREVDDSTWQVETLTTGSLWGHGRAASPLDANPYR